MGTEILDEETIKSIQNGFPIATIMYIHAIGIRALISKMTEVSMSAGHDHVLFHKTALTIFIYHMVQCNPDEICSTRMILDNVSEMVCKEYERFYGKTPEPLVANTNPAYNNAVLAALMRSMPDGMKAKERMFLAKMQYSDIREYLKENLNG